MTPTYKKIQILAAEAEVSISEAARLAGVDRSFLERLRRHEPKAVRNINAITAALEAKIHEQNKTAVL